MKRNKFYFGIQVVATLVGILMKWDALEDEPCSIARTVAVIGDRWTLLILRESFLRIRRFDEFRASLGITRHLLATPQEVGAVPRSAKGPRIKTRLSATSTS